MEILGFIVYFLITLWVVSFLYNIYYFFKNDDTELDTVFINLSKTFEESHIKLNILEKILGRSLIVPRKKITFYENNARKTRRKYRYFSSYIEPGFVKIFVGRLGSTFKKCWKNLDAPVRYHYINIYIFIGLLALFSIIFFFAIFGFYAILFLIFIAVFMLRLYNFIIKINFILFYILLDGILIIFKQDRGKLMKNVALLELMTNGWFGDKRRGSYVVGAAGVAIYSSFGGGGAGGFGGFGGGSFGGGGAGGSW